MAGLNVVLRDKDGKIKQDVNIHRDKEKGKVIDVDKLKKDEELEVKKWMKKKQKKYLTIQKNC